MKRGIYASLQPMATQIRRGKNAEGKRSYPNLDTGWFAPIGFGHRVLNKRDARIGKSGMGS